VDKIQFSLKPDKNKR